jgi:hypothetical protein
MIVFIGSSVLRQYVVEMVRPLSGPVIADYMTEQKVATKRNAQSEDYAKYAALKFCNADKFTASVTAESEDEW